MNLSQAQMKAIPSSGRTKENNQSKLTGDEQHDLAWKLLVNEAPSVWKEDTEMDDE